VPARIAALGFGFFCMITLTSYTANLATLLVTRARASGISSLQEAIDTRMRICLLSSIAPEFTFRFKQACCQRMRICLLSSR
jgi:hypothetical protein